MSANASTRQGHAAPPQAVAPQALPELIVEVTRGAMVESRHRVLLAVSDSLGRLLLYAGDPERPVYPRSAIKPLQALALIESGAASAFGLASSEIALACASHLGEPGHVAGVEAWLQRIGCSERDLECGAHRPYDEAACDSLAIARERPSAMHNNCSGKHVGFLSVARHLGYETKGYVRYDHPVQQRVLGVLESMTGLDLSSAPRGVDGCGIPTCAVPLGNLAMGMARLVDPDDQAEPRRAACARVCRAMAEQPVMVSGTGHFCSTLIAATDGRALIKNGAEGVYCGALQEHGLGIALKVEDGAGRAAEAAMVAVLRRLNALDEAALGVLSERHPTVLRNRSGIVVGEIRAAGDSLH